MCARISRSKLAILRDLQLLFVFTSIAHVTQVGCANAQTLMRYASGDYDIHRGLIAAGVLNARVGEASKKELEAAIDFYARVYGSVDVSNREAAQATIKRVKDHYTTLSQALNIQEDSKNAGRKVAFPSAIVPDRTDAGNETFYRSKVDNVLINTYRFRLQNNPPIERLQEIFAKAASSNIHAYEQSAHGFEIRLDDIRNITKDGVTTPTRRHQVKHAFASGGTVTGHYISYLDTPLDDFSTPPNLAPLAAYWTTRTLLDIEDAQERRAQISQWISERKLPQQQAAELLAAVEGDPTARSPEAIDKLLAQWMWRQTMTAMSFLTASKFMEDNRWTTIGIEKCLASKEPANGTQNVRIVFATNRAGGTDGGLVKSSPADWFVPAADEKNTLVLGCASVSVPNDETASMRLSLAAGSAASVGEAEVSSGGFGIVRKRLLGSVNAEQSAYQLRLNDKERWLFPKENRALVFIHGYNTSFEYALLRLAQIAAATRYEGRVYLYSWPSAESWKSYWADMDTAERSELHLAGFLRAILSDPEIQKVDIVAHSMGSQMLLRSLNDLRDVFYARARVRLGQVLFAAPDLSTDVFAEKIREISALSEAVTVYGSAKDKALQVSRYTRGSPSRLGLISDGVAPKIPGMTFVDATSPSNICNVWGYAQMEHSYFAESLTMLKHITAVLSRSHSANNTLSAQEAELVTRADGGHLILKPDASACWWN